ncbi:MAG: hypothetical protein HC896_17950, partial [Bacteroidales bacterium]|nr:hypothetical protein [Bacteroidales bacterium]
KLFFFSGSTGIYRLTRVLPESLSFSAADNYLKASLVMDFEFSDQGISRKIRARIVIDTPVYEVLLK